MGIAIWQNLILMLVVVLLVALLYRQLRSFIRRRKPRESWLGCIERISREQQTEVTRQLQLDIVPLHMRVANVVILLGFMMVEGYLAPWLGHAWMSYSQIAFGVYVLIGYVVVRFIVPNQVNFITVLTLSHRLDVQLYYVWWWPVAVLKAVIHRLEQPHKAVPSFPVVMRPRRHIDAHRKRPRKMR
ncbi:hypothetical protein WI77_06945 [Burkholderia ubonensis]|uniref:hypothetical protein n=1 Tax=Burkholderia ubonensis TaxID=101571 RepID=UPI00075AB5C8|nr:hypothetical protein [Burkholderia ubonensis]KVC98052.1 hypothetical protein WI77_06945 [Burkholderia ubonensis]KVQ98670.1 hypothetical protein WK08_03150 [Burkholderia ubonensis]